MSTSETTLNHASGDSHHKGHSHKKSAWPKRILTLVFFIVIPALLYSVVKKIEWDEVKQGLQSLEISTLLLGTAIALCSYIVFASYDLIGKKYTGHSLSTWKVIPLGFVCYAFNLNLSTWVGGIAMRLRLYTRLGLNVPTITKIFSLSVIANWLGYIILAGIIFSLGLLQLPDNWKLGTASLRVIGVVLLAVAILYFASCKYAKRRTFRLFKHKFELPQFSMALTQAGLAILNWSLMGLIIFSLLPKGDVTYPTVLGILLLSSIAGVITHIPGGLGVLETIFITMLQHQLSKGSILAALIGYRIIYFLIPLAIALVIYLILESQAKKLRTKS
jgi:uncharacterized membrane protein YbhN (UPF0104 family)